MMIFTNVVPKRYMGERVYFVSWCGNYVVVIWESNMTPTSMGGYQPSRAEERTQMSKEQEQLRLEIRDSVLGATDTSMTIDEATDDIMTILAERCWLKGNEKPPRCTFGTKIFGMPNDGYMEGQQNMQREMIIKGWRPVMPIEKEEK